jgi:hypothetical protein
MLNSISCVPFKNAFSEAYRWLKKSRKHYPSSSDIWDFRRVGNVRSEEVIRLFLLGSYRLDFPKKITRLSPYIPENVKLWDSPADLVGVYLNANYIVITAWQSVADWEEYEKVPETSKIHAKIEKPMAKPVKVRICIHA